MRAALLHNTGDETLEIIDDLEVDDETVLTGGVTFSF